MAFSFIGGGTEENHQPAASHWQTLSHNVVLDVFGHCALHMSLRPSICTCHIWIPFNNLSFPEAHDLR